MGHIEDETTSVLYIFAYTKSLPNLYATAVKCACNFGANFVNF